MNVHTEVMVNFLIDNKSLDYKDNLRNNKEKESDKKISHALSPNKKI
jgi:hypothetical protein